MSRFVDRRWYEETADTGLNMKLHMDFEADHAEFIQLRAVGLGLPCIG